MENLISVVVPVYNAQLYLPECLDSIINQSYKHLEIILVKMAQRMIALIYVINMHKKIKE